MNEAVDSLTFNFIFCAVLCIFNRQSESRSLTCFKIWSLSVVLIPFFALSKLLPSEYLSYFAFEII